MTDSENSSSPELSQLNAIVKSAADQAANELARAQEAANSAIGENERANNAATAAGEERTKAKTAADAASSEHSRSKESADLAASEMTRAATAASSAVEGQNTAKAAAEQAAKEQERASIAATAATDEHSSAKEAAEKASAEHTRATSAANAAIEDQTKASAASSNAASEHTRSKTAADQSEVEQEKASKAAATAAEKLKELNSTLEKSITSSLGGAFQKKADNAKKLDLAWLVVLLIGIGSIVCLGYLRYPVMTELIRERAEITYLAFQMLISIFSMSGPIWLSWVATKRLAKTFAISEDYAYKAAIAQAYQGYRDSVKDGDPLMQQRLFATVVTQLDANPVRFLSTDHPASPLQDLLQQSWMEEALKDNTFKQKFIDWFKYKYGKIFSIPETK